MGNAIMSFYSALIDLLGRCAPEMHVCFYKAVTFLQFSCNCLDGFLQFTCLSFYIAHQQRER